MGQQHLAFLQSQAAHIEAAVYEEMYPDIQYPGIVPVNTEASAYAGQITYYGIDSYGEADFLATRGQDFPFVDIDSRQYNVRVENLAIGYRYDQITLEQAMLIPNANLETRMARAARRVAEEKIDKIVKDGVPSMGWDGLINSSLPTVVNAGGVWANRTGEQIADDINNAISGIYADTLTVEMANTLLLPVKAHNTLATKLFADGFPMTVLDWVERNNVYTRITKQPLMIRTYRGLETAGGSNSGRMVAYNRHPSVIQLHMPMPLMFFPAQQHMLDYCVPGLFRLGGLEIRRPKAMRYVDGIM